MKSSTRVIWIVLAVVIGLGLLAGGFLLGRASSGLLGYGFGLRGGNFGFGMTLAPALRFGASAGVNGFGFGGIIPMVLTILFWIALIALAVWLISSLVSRASSQPHSNLPVAESALDILKKRYARGEITKEQFDEMRRDLNA